MESPEPVSGSPFLNYVPPREFLDSLPVAVYGCDAQGRIRFFNKSAARLWGRTPQIDRELFCGAHRRFAIDGRELRREETPMAQALKSGEPIASCEGLCERPDGSRAVCEMNLSPIRDEAGRLLGVFNVLTDITENFEARETQLKKTLLESVQLRERMEKAERTKSSFLTNMSHEMRTPLTAIIGFSELMQSLEMSDEQRRGLAQRISRNGSNLLQIIESVLELSRIEGDGVSLNARVVSPWDAVSEALSEIKPQPEKAHIAFDVRFDSEFLDDITTDPVRLKQILMHLLENALKFTEQGAITIHLKSERTANGVCAIFEIADTGVGIEEKFHDELFRAFTPGDPGFAKRAGGVGLGLHLSRRLAEKLGGELTLSWSERGVGSRFRLRLPSLPPESASTQDFSALKAPEIREPRESLERLIASRPLEGRRVLVVDDNADNLTVISTFLKLAGALAETAANGERAVETTRNGWHDLVLMDLQMPVLDGIDATKRLRENGFLAPILALSAFGEGEEIDRARLAGCNDHLSKPISCETLVKKIVTHLSH